jgi:hypothetical protein
VKKKLVKEILRQKEKRKQEKRRQKQRNCSRKTIHIQERWHCGDLITARRVKTNDRANFMRRHDSSCQVPRQTTTQKNNRSKTATVHTGSKG